MYGGAYKYIKPVKHPKGYMKVGLGKEGSEYVHRLVAVAFVENPDNKPHVNHKDGNKENNLYINLEWCTPIENNNHCVEVLGTTIRKPIVLIKRDGTFVREYISEKSCLEDIKSVKGFILIPKSEYSNDRVKELISPKKRVYKKGRKVYVPNARRRLSKNQVLEIMDMYKPGVRLYHIAKQVGCEYTTVKNVVEGKNYNDITGIPK